MTATTLDGVMLHGVAGSRPAASAVAKGTLYFATDTNVVSQSDGASTWTNCITPASNPLTTTGDIIYSSSGTTAARLAVGTATQLLHGGASVPAYSAVVEGDLSTSDITTANATTSKHGFLLKLDNNAAHYMDGTGAWSTPAGTFNPDVDMPWTIPINPYSTPTSNTNWNSLAADTGRIGAFAKESNGSQNAQITWTVVLAAGTWTVEWIGIKASDRGIYTLNFDAVSKGTVDAYTGAGTAKNQYFSVSSIAVATTAKIAVQLIMATKNASSSAYYGDLSAVNFLRTA